MDRLKVVLARLVEEESGQELARYAIIAALVALGIVLFVPALRDQVDDILYHIGDGF